MSYRIRLLETDEGWSVSCLLEVEAEEAGVKTVETLELAV